MTLRREAELIYEVKQTEISLSYLKECDTADGTTAPFLSVTISQSTRRNITEDSSLYKHHCEHLKSWHKNTFLCLYAGVLISP